MQDCSGCGCSEESGVLRASPGLDAEALTTVPFGVLLCLQDECGKALSDQDIRAEVDTFMFGGE